jgi:4-hydroxybenzoate polyprenyltransferase
MPLHPNPHRPVPVLPDAAPRNWVDRAAPAAWRPYLRLARIDRPIGAWLLLFPCWWSEALAALAHGRTHSNGWSLTLFFVGAFVMRGAGCTYNDIVDRDFDARVERTAQRPLPSKQVSVGEARTLLVLLCLVGLLILVQFNAFTIKLAAASLLLVIIYPFAKRYTYWPQLVLGLTFSWGGLVGWSSVAASLAAPAIALYAGSVLWTIGYDTIYAHQDKEDDLIIGVKSTALKFGAATRWWVGGFYTGAILLWAIAGGLAGAHLLFLLGLALASLQLAWQVATLVTDDADNCLARFKSNQLVGWALFLGLSADMLALGPTGAA